MGSSRVDVAPLLMTQDAGEHQGLYIPGTKHKGAL